MVRWLLRWRNRDSLRRRVLGGGLPQMKRELEGLALDSKRPTAGRGEIPKQQQMAQESSDDARRRERGQQGGASE
uniref:Uncharacterized protein n=1 Tax=Chromera velia CCMP2878 TaxID=1169474 RepID=A0A0G4HZ02_9ALVE|eukprot:Cvel_9621.t1-p1 / transcript=Cvel_9621.t1 / gene=Cvel_9621 / organism=Chromera_velia_CCMP2878 / gene_product=hypothetical protein / transcript_product=hypothetical protein / location=Cvel_scaffold559:52644-54139(+) / protein_length=74 / sequence_SO=supercontig / SO=protein_coding / is_pseudo=false